ncbi:MAG: methyltransferase domain-containing protein [Nitrosomonas sp.]|nr:MAG: methyltransferase domain-containing protein [Nitrosomonas sp.]
MPGFPLFRSHLDLAHTYWKQLVSIGDTVIDATCGNGHDTLMLARLVIDDSAGDVYGLDIQSTAIDNSRQLLHQELPTHHLQRIHLLQQCHSTFPDMITAASVKLIVYNLGYLPGGNKSLTTRVETTLQSLNAAVKLLSPGGCLSITLYPGHPEGAIEESQVLPLIRSLSSSEWSCCHHQWINRPISAPSLLLVQKLG